jgi:hypothetical protein
VRSDLESELLIRCCTASATSSAAIGELAARPVEWDRFLALANRNSVTPLVAARLGAEAAAYLPQDLARAFELSYQVITLHGAPRKLPKRLRRATCRQSRSRVRRSQLPRTAMSRCEYLETSTSWCASRTFRALTKC